LKFEPVLWRVVGNWITFSSRFVGAIVFAIVFGGLVYIGYGNESMSVQRTPSFWRVEGKAHRRLFLSTRCNAHAAAYYAAELRAWLVTSLILERSSATRVVTAAMIWQVRS
jgi:hypothetical protein